MYERFLLMEVCTVYVGGGGMHSVCRRWGYVQCMSEVGVCTVYVGGGGMHSVCRRLLLYLLPSLDLEHFECLTEGLCCHGDTGTLR